MKMSKRLLTIAMLSITIVGIAVYNTLLAAGGRGGGGMGGGRGGMGGHAGMGGAGAARMSGASMARPGGFSGRNMAMSRTGGAMVRTAPTGTRTFAQGAGVNRNWNRGNFNRNPNWNRGNWNRGRFFAGRRFFGPRFGFGFFAGAPWWWGSYAYPWYSPYWDSIGLQQQILFLQQQIAYLMQQLNSIADAQQQEDLQGQIAEYQDQLANLTGQPYGYGY